VGSITAWTCRRCRAKVAGEESPRGWAVLVVVDPPLADPHAFDRIVICDSCNVALRNVWLNHR
jgi:hypothetical protein